MIPFFVSAFAGAHAGRHLWFFACLLLSLSVQTFAATVPIRFSGQNAELVLSEVSERTLRVEVFPFNEHERSRPPEPRSCALAN